jgi:RNA polymerase sigma factor (sigma-70 family)
VTPLAELVIRAQSGDRDSFAEVVERFREYAYGRAFAVLGDHQLAEDAVQEAFAEAFFSLDKLREPAAFPGWFKRIVIKRIDRIIRGKKVPMASLDAVGETFGEIGTEPTQDDESGFLAGTVKGALDTLPDHERAAARMYYLDERAQRDIADELGVPVTTIKKRLWASRQRLKKTLGEFAPLDAAAEQEEALPRDVQLFAAARNGFAHKVAQLLNEDPSLVNAANDDGLTIQLYAAHAMHHSGNAHVVEVLLARGADIDAHTGAALGMTTHVRHMLERNAAMRRTRSAWERTPLHWAASGGHLELVQWLLAHGADANAWDRWGCTPLHLAAELGRVEIVRELIDAGADIESRLKNGKTVLHLAAQSGNTQIVEMLLSRDAALDIFAAASLGFREYLRKTLARRPKLVHARLPFGATPLHMAAESGRGDMAEFLVEQGAPLDLVGAAELGWTDRVRELLEKQPAVVNAKSGSFGFTALHSATSKGHRDLARLLLAGGAEVNATDDMYQKTPLGEALFYGNEAMVRLLHRHGGEA